MPSQQEVRWSQLKVGVIVLISSVILVALLFLMTSSAAVCSPMSRSVSLPYGNSTALFQISAPGGVKTKGKGKAAKGKKTIVDPKELTAKTFTLQTKEMDLGKVLAELAKQTGNRVEDRRRMKEDAKIKVDLKNVTFWQALDELTIRLHMFYEYDVGLRGLKMLPSNVENRSNEPVTSYSSAFRVETLSAV